jgi:hypothetical protein
MGGRDFSIEINVLQARPRNLLQLALSCKLL